MTGLEEAARLAVEAALDAGATDAEAWAERSTGREVHVYGGEVESLSDAGGRGVGVRALAGERSGYAYGTDLSAPGVAGAARAAVAAAAVADPDEHGGLPDEPGTTPVAGLHSAELARWPTERKVELALAVERAALARPGVGQVEAAVYADAECSVAISSSRGLDAGYESTQAWTYATAFAGEGADLMTGVGIAVGRDPAALDPRAVGEEAADRALALAGARQPESRRCPVVLDAFVAASFVGILGSMLSADAVQRERSPFAGREGEAVADPSLALVDDGTLPDGPASAPFDGEGSPTRRTRLIRDGRLAGLLLDCRTARRAGRETTGNARRGSYRAPPSVRPANLVVEGGGGDLDRLLARAGDGLLVMDVAGLHSGVNPVSGTFSVGASGRLIRGGELGEPVRELTIAGDLVSLLRSIRAVGSEGRWVPFGGSVRAAPILVGELSVSGT